MKNNESDRRSGGLERRTFYEACWRRSVRSRLVTNKIPLRIEARPAFIVLIEQVH